MKKLSRLDIRGLIEKKTSQLNEGTREDAMASAIASIEKEFGKGAIYDPSFDKVMIKQMERSKSPDVVQDIGLAYDLMIKHAPNVTVAPPIHRGATTQSGMGQAVGEIASKTNLDKRFIRFHLKKAVAQEEQGKLIGLPSGGELIQQVLNKREEAARAAKEKGAVKLPWRRPKYGWGTRTDPETGEKIRWTGTHERFN